MATIHISDISVQLSSLLAHIRHGDRVVIEENAVAVAILTAPEHALVTATVHPPSRSISEAIRMANQRASTATLDDQFGDDLEATIRMREQETLRNPWE